MLAMCASTVFGARNSAIADRLVRAALGHQREDLALPLGEVVERHPGPPPADELGDDLRIDHRSPARDPADGLAEVVQVLDAILEQVADATRPIGHEAHGEGRLDVLREDEDADVGAVLGADRLRRPEALVGVGRRHPDVDDRHVRSMAADGLQELIGGAGLGDRP